MLFSKPNIQNQRRSALTLVEVLIAMAMILVILGAMMSAFQYASSGMARGRAAIELNNRLVAAQEQLRRDLDRITVELKPHQFLPALPNGYVEIVDGTRMDYNFEDDNFDENGNPIPEAAARGHNGTNLVYGDTDDFFACTIRSGDRAFRGRFGNEIEESHLAEVAWYSIPNVDTANPDDFILVRRQLLIKPQLNNGASVGTAATPEAFAAFVRNNDLSVRLVGTTIMANSLADLGLRGNRFAHVSQPTPQESILLPADQLVNFTNSENFMFTSMAAFDVQVYAPDASVRVVGNQIAEPGEIGTVLGVGDPQQSGAYVDLGKLPGINPTFGVINPAYGLPIGIGIYDTGTSQYDRDDPGDRGANGVDDDGNGAVDDAAEKISQPPVNARIRGLRFRMRTFEQINKQVRQMSVSKSFLPQ